MKKKPSHALIQMNCVKRICNFVLPFLLLYTLFLTKVGRAQSYSLNTTGALPDSSAMLDVMSADKGILIPRVNLLSITDSATIAHPAISLQVYNTNASIGRGFWYWNGNRWIQIIGSRGGDSVAINSSVTTPLLVGGTSTISSLTYKTTTGVGTTGADHIFKVGDNGNTEAMRILNNGRIGIGTSSPNDFIEVNGGNIRLNNTNGGEGIKFRSTSGTGNKTALYFINSAGTERWRIIQDISANGTDDLRFNSNNNNTTVLSLLQSGNVGIGTGSPTQKLHVVTTTSLLGRFDTNTPTTTNSYDGSLAIVNSDTTTNNKVGVSFWGGSSSQRLISGIAGIVTTPNSSAITQGGALSFYTNTAGNSSYTEKMRITDAGRVGIGTSVPSDKLTVECVSNTTPQLVLSSQSGNGISSNELIGGLNFYSNDPDLQASSATINSYADATHTASQLASRIVFSTTTNGSTSPTEKVRITNAGDVGIGTTAPQNKLDVEGGLSIGAPYSGSSAAPTDGAIIKGKVGIGTSTPAFKLHVADTTALRNGTKDVLTIENTIPVNSNPYLGHGQAIAFYSDIYWSTTKRVLSRISSVINDHSSSYNGTDLIFQNSTLDTVAPTTKMIIRYNGNVGIGTTTPGSKLDVNGTSNFNGNMAITGNVTITGSGTYSGTWTLSDRMFKKDIDNLGNALAIIKKLSPKSYYFNTEKFNGKDQFNFSSTKQYGFIAQDLEAVLPDVVSVNVKQAVLDAAGNQVTPEFTYRTVNYTALIPILTKGIQELQAKNDMLEERLNQVTERLHQLEKH